MPMRMLRQKNKPNQTRPLCPGRVAARVCCWTVPGLALIGGGVAYAVVASQAAEAVNQRLAPSDPEYQTAYDKAALNAYIGYGAAGVGVIGTGIGAAYLFGKDGLGRSGKGTLLLSTGVLTAGMGGWLLLGAMDVAASAGKIGGRRSRTLPPGGTWPAAMPWWRIA